MKSIKKVITVGVLITLFFSTLISLTGTTKDVNPLDSVTAEMNAVHADVGDSSYFTTTLRNVVLMPGAKLLQPIPPLEFIFEGWCVDTSQDMDETIWYKIQAYSSYEGYPEGIVDYPENLDLVNYIINQDYVGKMSRCGTEFTYGDVQRAMWILIDDRPSLTPKLGPWEQCRVRQILHEAWDNGDGYVPGWGDEVAILLDCLDPEDGQTSIIELPIPRVHYQPCKSEPQPPVYDVVALFENFASDIIVK